MKKLDLTKPVQTRDGRPARILATDVRHASYPVAAVVTHPDDSQSVIVFTRDGGYYDESSPYILDLVNVPEKKVWEEWVTIYPGRGMTFHPSYEDALMICTKGGTIIHVRHEYIEGEHQP